jgi:hypothetical protein
MKDRPAASIFSVDIQIKATPVAKHYAFVVYSGMEEGVHAFSDLALFNQESWSNYISRQHNMFFKCML